jgi:hypothetical protein
MRLLLFNIIIIIFTTSSSAQQTMGLFFNDEKSENGYTVFSNNETTYLIDNCGFKVNEWESEYKSSNGLLITTEGDLIRQGQFPGNVNFGGAGGIIERFSWNGDLEWSYQIADDQFFAHHDMMQLPNGNLIVLVWSRVSGSQAAQEGRAMTGHFYTEQIWELQELPNNQASVVWKWSALDHVIQDNDDSKSNFGTVADHPELIDINYVTADVNANTDWLHVNSVDYNEATDQIIINSRNTSEVYVIDHSTSIEEAASHEGGMYGRGGDILYRYGNPEAYDQGEESDRMLHQAHDVSWITSGEHAQDFIIFNNNYIFNTRSRIQIWNNPTEDGFYSFSNETKYGADSLKWTYDDAGFYSSRMSSAQIMPNGNILATEGTSGEISEITPSKEKIWKYINPVNRNGGPGIQGGTPQFNSLFKSSRYTDDYIGFEDYNLVSGDPVEFSLESSECQIYTSTATDDEEKLQLQFSISNQYITWNNENLPIGEIYIFDVLGRLCIQSDLSLTTREIDISSLNSGVYILKANQYAGSVFYKN